MASMADRTRKRDKVLRAYELRYVDGKQPHEIALILGCTTIYANQLIREGARLYTPVAEREAAKEAELAELDCLRTQAYEMFHGEYVVVQFGKIAYQTIIDSDGQVREVPLRDIGPNLAALDRIIRIGERKAKILGYEAPRRSAVHVITEDPITAEINRLRAEMDEAAVRMAEEEARDAVEERISQPDLTE